MSWLLRVALVATLVLTASGEYVFATRVGWHPFIAWAMAVSLDVYVICALRARRDVAVAIGLMAATNVAAHSVEMIPGLTVDGRPVWWLVAAASALPPVVLWRIHRLAGHGDQAGGEMRESVPDVSAPVSMPRLVPVLVASGSAVPVVVRERSREVPVRAPRPRSQRGRSGAARAGRAPSLTWDEALDKARQMAAEQGAVPSFRALAAVPGMGSQKAQRVREALELESDRASLHVVRAKARP